MVYCVIVAVSIGARLTYAESSLLYYEVVEKWEMKPPRAQPAPSARRRVWVQDPKLRLEYVKLPNRPDGYTIWRDGCAYQVSPETKAVTQWGHQSIQGNISGQPWDLRMYLMGITARGATLSGSEMLEGQETNVYSMPPFEGQRDARLKAWISKKTGLPLKEIIFTAQYVSTRIFENIQENPPEQTDPFSFPADYRVSVVDPSKLPHSHPIRDLKRQ